MQIEPILLQNGLTESIINFFHSRTNNKHYTIISVRNASGFRIDDTSNGIKVCITLKNDKGNKHYVEYTIDVTKIRQKKLNILLNK